MPSLAALPPLVLVMFGGAIGAGLRFAIGRWTLAALGPGLPFGTWAVNIAGGFAMGLLAGWLTTPNATFGGRRPASVWPEQPELVADLARLAAQRDFRRRPRA